MIKGKCKTCGRSFMMKPYLIGIRKYCSIFCRPVHQLCTPEANKKKGHKGATNLNWKGGKTTYAGYIALLKPEHSNSNKRGYILEHRYIMSKFINRPLKQEELVHHKNHNHLDNRIENLQIITRADHNRIHHSN